MFSLCCLGSGIPQRMAHHGERLAVTGKHHLQYIFVDEWSGKLKNKVRLSLFFLDGKENRTPGSGFSWKKRYDTER